MEIHNEKIIPPPTIDTGKNIPVEGTPSISPLELERLAPYLTQAGVPPDQQMQFLEGICNGSSATPKDDYQTLLSMLTSMLSDEQAAVNNNNYEGFVQAYTAMGYLVNSYPINAVPPCCSPSQNLYFSPYGYDLLGQADLNYNFHKGQLNPTASANLDTSSKACGKVLNELYVIFGLQPEYVFNTSTNCYRQAASYEQINKEVSWTNLGPSDFPLSQKELQTITSNIGYLNQQITKATLNA